ncbi:cache domain-containing protein [Desulfovibrio mangrovi]|uniref:cache domain-containing protein n=1 Tax=Desulfovibrio mangrovi TaxID=2976983 RepID=UPI002247A635|nr:cache domain-containing protein [Desulfovibrio mangrovi]UZP68768.1 cache domain-containing protein [Desulfovibrio mangrovi]
MFNSMKVIILLFVAVLVVTTATGVTFFAQREITRSASQTEFKHAQGLVEAVYLNVVNEYQSLIFYEQTALERRKQELRAVMDIAYAVVQRCYAKYKSGIVSESAAKEEAREALRSFRYDEGVGYIWLNNTESPIPKLIMHPTLPELVGKPNDDPKFNVAMGPDKNLFVAFRKTVENGGSGYVNYLWPKPTPGGLSSDQPKLSYVRIFKEWEWIIGTGVYIDDIETDVTKRRNAILQELQDTFSKITIAESGYMYIFTGERNFIIHPLYTNVEGRQLLNHLTGRPLLEELVEASQGDGTYEYLWDKPPDHVGEFRFRKRGYVKYFTPLDWYICAAVYTDELEKPGLELRNKIILLSGTILVFALLTAAACSGRIVSPLLRLTAAAKAIRERGVYAVDIPVSGPSETRELGIVINQMLESITRSMKEKEQLVSELAEGNRELVASNERLETEIAEHRLAKEELTRLRNHLKNIIDSMPSILVGVDKEGLVTQWNAGAQHAIGFTFEEVQGRPLADVFPVLAREMDRARTVIQNGQTDERARVPRVVEGETRYENITVYPLMENGLEGAVIRLDDVTTRVRIEEMMIQTEKMMSVGGLAAGMAHEINNPLGGILQGAQNIERRLSPDLPGNITAAEECGLPFDAMRRYMEDRKILKMVSGIRESAERAAQIIANMLDFSRKSEAHQTSSLLNELVDKAVDLASQDYDLKKKYDFRQIELVRDYEDNLPYVVCAPTEIEQVLLNLFGNAAQAMSAMGEREEPSRITIRLRQEGGFVVTEVADNGPGMPEDVRKRVFEPFFTTKPKGIGTGLGLSVSYFIITQNHGGAFSVESKVGEGTTFIFRLPIKA